MRQLFNCEVGLSDHTMGVDAFVAAVAHGATVIEKHFTLSRADGGVDSAFSMEPDEMGLAEARARGLKLSKSLPLPPAALLLDSIHVPSSLSEWAHAYFPRILISTICDRADLASHVLVRDAPDSLRAALTDGVELYVDHDFAFTTAQGLQQSAINFDTLKVGLCLSGGDDPIDLDAIIATIALNDGVTEIRVIDRRFPASNVPSGVTLLHSPPCREPWQFLSGINVFIGGDGVMLSEAIVQAIPSVSLTTSDRIDKNRFLMNAGAMFPLSRVQFQRKAITDLLSDRNELSRMHDAAKRLARSHRAEALSQRIIEILRTAQP